MIRYILLVTKCKNALFGFEYYKHMIFCFKPVFMNMQVYPNKLLDAKAAKKTDTP